MAQKQNRDATLVSSVRRATRVHFWYVGAYATAVIAFDAWKLITPDALLERWTLVASMLAVSAVAWYAARTHERSQSFYATCVAVLVLLDIWVATFSVYMERGMASRSVVLFAVPIILAAASLRRTAVWATATLCIAAYSLAAIRYFVMHPSEGYKVELYGNVGFYSAVFLVMAGLLTAVLGSVREKS